MGTRDSRRAASSDRRHAVVIGAGLAGLAAGLHLRGEGWDVTVVERAARPGGLVRTDTYDGLAFDTGATVLTMSELIVDALGAVGVDPDDASSRLRLVDVDPTYVARFADGTELPVHRDHERLRREVTERFGNVDANGVAALQKWLSDLNDAEFDSFMARNFHDPRALADRRTVTDAATLVRMGALRSLAGAVGRHVDDERLQRIFTFQALYAGMPPQRAKAIYGIIAHMDIGLGVRHPIGGMGRVGEVMAQALVEAGGSIAYRSTAVGLDDSKGRVRAVTTVDADGHTTHHSADAVIATLAPPRIAELLGRPLPRGPRWRGVRYSPSAVVIHGITPRAVTSSWPGHHHTIDFGDAWSDTFTDLTRTPGRPMNDPSFLLTRPAFTDPETFSTETAEAVSVLAPCPNLDVADLDWKVLQRAYITECLQTLEMRGYTDIARALRIVRVDHPGTWAADGLPAGTPFGAAHSLTQTGPLRTPNRWSSISNLYLAGAHTLPGVGIPPVLVSGRLAADRALAETR